MNRTIAIVVTLTVAALFVTNSLYVEEGEFLLILASSAVISLELIRSPKQQGKHKFPFFRFCTKGYLFFGGFALLDLVLDHLSGSFLLPPEEEDGRALTLWEVLEEFRDDLFVLSLIFLFVLTALFSILTPRNN